jgi:hypothetical protein
MVKTFNRTSLKRCRAMFCRNCAAGGGRERASQKESYEPALATINGL